MPKIEKLSPHQAAQRSQLSIWTIYRLYHSGLIEGERPAPRTIKIYANSLDRHVQATRSDPEFWQTHSI